MPTIAIYALIALFVSGLGYGIVNGYNSALQDAENAKEETRLAQAAQRTAEIMAVEKEFNVQIERFEREELEKKYAVSEKKADDLAKLFQEHEFGNLYDKKPGLILKRVNAGSKRVFDVLAETINNNTTKDEGGM